AHISAEATLPQCVVYQKAEERHRDHQERARGPRCISSERLLTHVVHHADKEDSREPRVSSAPTEPVQRPRQQFGVNTLFGWAVQFSLERSVDKIEEVKVPDPHDSRKDVQPPENCLKSAHQSSSFGNASTCQRGESYHSSVLGCYSRMVDARLNKSFAAVQL